jgi:hypothetical protein
VRDSKAGARGLNQERSKGAGRGYFDASGLNPSPEAGKDQPGITRVSPNCQPPSGNRGFGPRIRPATFGPGCLPWQAPLLAVPFPADSASADPAPRIPPPRIRPPRIPPPRIRPPRIPPPRIPPPRIPPPRFPPRGSRPADSFPADSAHGFGPLPSVQAAFLGRLHSWQCPSVNS